MVKFGKKIVVYLKERKAKIFSLLYARKGKIMALSNLENRVKQDSAYPRTAEDAIRRDKDIDKVTIKASQIELEGYTTINGGFKIDKEGNMECVNASITGGKINMESTENNPSFILKSTEYPTLHTEVTGGSLGIYELEHQSESVTVWGPRCAMSYFRNQGYSTFGLWGKESYMRIGEHYLNDNLISPVTIYELNGGRIELTSNDGTITIDCNGSNGNIKCVSLTQTSLAEKKKNFEKLENALDIVKDTDIYKYNLKDEKETDKKHIGFVIGENFNYRKEITSQENDSAELYSMISVLWKAVQEQQEEIEELRKLVNK